MDLSKRQIPGRLRDALETQIGKKKAQDNEDRDALSQLEIDRKEEEVKGLKTTREIKKSYAERVFWLVLGYWLTVLALLLAAGSPSCPFNLSDTVLGILVGSTAAAVISQIGFITRGLFSTLPSKE